MFNRVIRNIFRSQLSFVRKLNAFPATYAVSKSNTTDYYVAKITSEDDPYQMQAIDRFESFGTSEKPFLVPSYESRRLIACVCRDDSTEMQYMFVHEGEPQNCNCGYYYKLMPAKKLWLEEDEER